MAQVSAAKQTPDWLMRRPARLPVSPKPAAGHVSDASVAPYSSAAAHASSASAPQASGAAGACRTVPLELSSGDEARSSGEDNAQVDTMYRLGQRRVSLSDLRLGQNYLTGSLGKLWDNFFWYTFYTEQRGNIWKARVGSFGPQSCFKGTYRRHVNSCSGPAHSHVYRHFCGHWHTHVSRHGYATQACVLWQAYTFLACVDVCTEMWRR